MLLAGKLKRSELHKLNGLLEHFVGIFGLGRDMMAPLWIALNEDEPVAVLQQGEAVSNPYERVTLSTSLQPAAGKRIKFLGTLAGSTVQTFIEERDPLVMSSCVIDTHSDATSEATVVLNDEGYFTWYWWNWPLTPEAAQLHITCLEAIACWVNFFVFGQMYQSLIGEGCKLLTHCDSLASVLAVAMDRSKSKMLRFVFSELRQVAVFQKLLPHLLTTHEKGMGNVMADAGSRVHTEVLNQYAQVLRVKLVRRHVSAAAEQFIHRAVAYARTLSAAEQHLAQEQTNTPTSASFDMEEIHMEEIPRMVADDGTMVLATKCGRTTQGEVPAPPEVPRKVVRNVTAVQLPSNVVAAEADQSPHEAARQAKVRDTVQKPPDILFLILGLRSTR